MRNRFRSLVLIFTAAMLGACGGGGDSSSGSGSAATPVANSPFAGSYRGTATITLSALGQTLKESEQGTLTVRENGTIAGSVLNANGNLLPCNTSVQTPVVGADGKFTYVETGTCDASSQGFGQCTVSMTVNGTITGNTMRGNGPVELKCAAVTAKGSVSLVATRS